MRKDLLRLCVLIVFIPWLPGPAWAQDQDEARSLTIQQLRQSIDAQQTRLDAQNHELQQLRQQLQLLQAAPENNSLTLSPAVRSFARRNDLQTQRRDDNQSLTDWQGSLALSNSNTRIKIGGFVELDILHDNDAIQSKGQFIADSIPTRNATASDGTEGQTHFSVSPSRLYIETRTPVDNKRLKTFLSFDLFANELDVNAAPRVRQAYVEWNDALFGGDVLMGQAWSTTTDLESTPDMLDFRGHDSLFGQLQPQLRWSKPFADGFRFMLALETPGNHVIDGADALTRMPDGVVALSRDTPTYNFMGSLLVKDLRASANNTPVESALGFGGNLSGKLKLPYGEHPDELMFSVTYGKGIGSHFQNAKPDAVYDALNNRLQPLKLYGVMLAYRHRWTADMSSTLLYCCIEISNHAAQAADAIQGTEYTSGNFVWQINPHWLLGVEGIWGKRDDHDDAAGTVFRTQLTSRVSF